MVLLEWLDETPVASIGDKTEMCRNINKNVLWNNFSGSTHAYTTGRRHMDSNLNKVRPKGPSQTLKVIKKTFIFYQLKVMLHLKKVVQSFT